MLPLQHGSALKNIILIISPEWVSVQNCLKTKQVLNFRLFVSAVKDLYHNS